MFILHAAGRPGQLRPVQSKLLASPTDDPWIDNLPGAPKGNLGLLSLAMHGHHDGTFLPSLIVLIEAASPISKPSSKCRTFHFVLVLPVAA